MPNTTRIAIVGFGLIGKRHADTLKSVPDVELSAIVEPSERGQTEAAEYGVPCFDDLERMFSAVAVDGVILATPTRLHVPQGLECIDRDCAVLVEKPIAVTSEDALALTSAAAKKGVPLLVGHHRRHFGMVRAAKAALEEGAIGEIRAAHAICWFYKPDHYFEEAPWRKQKGAGPISVNLVHDVDLLRHFCGEVEQVSAVTVPSVRGFENEDLAAAILSFASGAVATITVSDSIVSPWSWEMTAGENPLYPATGQSCYQIGGSTGALSLPDLRVWRHENGPDWWSPIAAKSLIAEGRDPFVAQAIHFANVIQGTAIPLVAGAEGLRSLQVVEAVEKAAISKTPLKINPL